MRQADAASKPASLPHPSHTYSTRTQQLPDLSEKFEELHKERQERVAQAALEAGVETDEYFLPLQREKRPGFQL